MIRRLARKIRSVIPIPRRRRMHAYGIGAAKTGTTSLYGIFDTNFRAAHEPDRVAMIRMFQREEAGEVTRDDIVKFLRRRDRKLQLEMDSSALNRRYAGIMAEIFPKAKFILTVRDPFTRTESLINHLLNNPLSGEAKERADMIFHADRYQHAPEESWLLENGLHTIDGYLAEYAETTYDVIDSVPEDRLLVVRTDRLRDSLASIAEFLGIPDTQLDAGKSHGFKAKKRHGALLNVDAVFVDDKVRQHCGVLLERYFPEIGSINDVKARLKPD